MDGPSHYAKAEQCVGWAEAETDRDKRASLHARAQVHAILALAAAAALGHVMDLPTWDAEAWTAAAGTQVTP